MNVFLIMNAINVAGNAIGLAFGLGVVGVTLAMVCDWVIHAALILFRWKSGKWKTFRVI